MRKLILYFNSIKYLNIKRQIFGRVLFILKAQLVKFFIKKNYLQPNNKASFHKKDNYHFIKKKPLYKEFGKVNIINNEVDILNKNLFNTTSKNKLLNYHIHYFDYINYDDLIHNRELFTSLIESWIKKNKIAETTGWDSYPTSLRIVNWIKFIFQNKIENEIIFKSLAVQSRWLSKRIEFHLEGNHLISNAKALIFSGLFFSNQESFKWLEKGIALLSYEIRKQILDDGGHYERSPMYHAIVLEDLIDLIYLFELYKVKEKIRNINVKEMKEKILLMLTWLKNMTHPDGYYSFFNDTALYISPKFKDLNEYASRAIGVVVKKNNYKNVNMENSGFISMKNACFLLLADIGEITSRSQPGHSHAGTFSFELSINERRVFVNSGISTYENSLLRMFQRSTQAHNTLCLNNDNSSEIWHSFRMGNSAKVSKPEISYNKENIKVKCSHTGYQNKYGVIHTRTWNLYKNKLVINDETNQSEFNSVINLYIHPEIEIKNFIEDKVILLWDNKELAIMNFKYCKFEILDSFWYPSINKKIANKNFKIKPLNNKSEIIIDCND